MVPEFQFNGDIHYIPARVITTGRWMVSYLQAKKWVEVVSVIIKPAHQKVLAEAANAVSSVIDSSADFADPASDFSLVEDKIVGKNASWYLKD